MNEGMPDCGRASNGRYVSGCRCDACRAAHTREWKRREWRNLTGRTYYVDAEPVRRRLEELYAMGYTRRELDRMGIHKSCQYNLTTAHHRTGRPVERVRRETAERVMAVSGRKLAPHQLVRAEAAEALVRRWAEMGVPVARIARETGINRQTLDKLRHGRERRVRAETLLALLDHRNALDGLGWRISHGRA